MSAAFAQFLDDRPLTDTTWVWIAARLLNAAGIVRQYGRIPEMHGDWHRMRKACDQIEAELGLAITRPAAHRTPSHRPIRRY